MMNTTHNTHTSQSVPLEQWWKNAIAYQIYPRSFYDSNDDGIGDLKGITQKLGYLKDLGIDVIWICPMYRSPNDDNGYDISDYQDIMAEFGTMADFDVLLQSCHDLGMKLIIDLVINHTSDEHQWFIESSASKDNPKRDWYIWRDRHPNGKEPNNWESIFNGSAWKFDPQTDAWFLHLFSSKQPDLNWENPQVRDALYAMICWWLDKGVDGFRVDAISHIKKKARLPNLPNPKQLRYVPSFPYHMNVKGIETYLTELANQTFRKYDIMTVGEANGVKAAEAEFWVGQTAGIFNMIFQFEHLGLWQSESKKSVDVVRLKRVLSKWQTKLEGVGWNALYIENHDQPRAVSTWGDDQAFWYDSATCLATMYFLMKGTPFIYQGQEIGMTNVPFKHIDDYRDIASKNLYRELRAGNADKAALSDAEALAVLRDCSRDHSRTPMQWDATETAGFSKQTAWIKTNPNTATINVAAQVDDPDSVLNFYKQLIRLRKNNPVLLEGIYKLLLPKHVQIFAYTRTLKDQVIVVVCNMSNQPSELSRLRLPHCQNMLLSNFNTDKIPQIMPAYGAMVYLA